MEPASLGRRSLAFLIDLVMVTIVLVLVGKFLLKSGMGSDEAMFLTFTAVPPLTLLLCWLVGNTPGKRLMNLYIVDASTGETPSLFQYLRRSILFTLLIWMNIVWVIPVLVTRKRKGLHDMIAGTMVIEG